MVPQHERSSAWLVLVFDFLSPFIWIHALFTKQVRWGTTDLIVQRSGVLSPRLKLDESAPLPKYLTPPVN